MTWTIGAAIYLLGLCCLRAWREAGEPFVPRIDCALCLAEDLDFVYHPRGLYAALLLRVCRCGL